MYSCPKIVVKVTDTQYEWNKEHTEVSCKLRIAPCEQYSKFVCMLPMSRFYHRINCDLLFCGKRYNRKETGSFSCGFFLPEEYIYVGKAKYREGDTFSEKQAKKIARYKAYRQMYRFIRNCYRGVNEQIVDYLFYVASIQIGQCDRQVDYYNKKIKEETSE